MQRSAARADVMMFALDHRRFYGRAVLDEVEWTRKLGTPVVVVFTAPTQPMDSTDAVWSVLDGQCLTVDACIADADSVIRIIDAIEDRLFTGQPGSTGPTDSMRLGDWMRGELAAIGLPAYLTPEQIIRLAHGDEDRAEALGQRVEAAQLLTEGRIDQAVQLLGTLTKESRLGWSAQYFLGRLLAAQDRYAEAADQLEQAYRSLGPDDAMSESGADRLDLTRQACLITLVRLHRRHGGLDAAQRFLADLRRLPISSTGPGVTAVEIEQVRLDGRRGADGVADTANGLVMILWRFPDIALRLLDSVDLSWCEARWSALSLKPSRARWDGRPEPSTTKPRISQRIRSGPPSPQPVPSPGRQRPTCEMISARRWAGRPPRGFGTLDC